MNHNLPGYPPKLPTSFAPPVLQIALGVGLLILGWWAYGQAQAVRATDAFAYNGLSAIAAIAGLLWLPFAGTSLVAVVRNRRRKRAGRA